jgi:hypothetical protein
MPDRGIAKCAKRMGAPSKGLKNSGTALRLHDRDLWLLAEGHLDPVEENCGAAGADVAGGKGLHDSMDDDLSAFAVEPVGYFNAGLAWANGTLGAGVEITERAAAHGGRLAVESAGHDVTTFFDHKVLSCG